VILLKEIKYPLVTLTLVLINSLIFTALVASESLEITNEGWGLLPTEIRQGRALLTPFTSMFLHGNYLHLLTNMISLMVFGWLLEPKLGPLKFFGVYVLAHLAAAAIFIAVAYPGVAYGASAAIAGIAGACLILCSGDRIPLAFAFFLVFPGLSNLIFTNVQLVPAVWVIYFLLGTGIPIFTFILAPYRMAPIFPFLVIWMLLQMGDLISTQMITGTLAHLVGLLAGLTVALLLRKKIMKGSKWAGEIPAIR